MRTALLTNNVYEKVNYISLLSRRKKDFSFSRDDKFLGSQALSACISDNSKKNKKKKKENNNNNNKKKNKNKKNNNNNKNNKNNKKKNNNNNKNKNKKRRGTHYRWNTTDQAKKDKERNLTRCLSTTLGVVSSWYFVFPCHYNCTM
jgi:hypothetical protein